jgi:hypothetical protein
MKCPHLYTFVAPNRSPGEPKLEHKHRFLPFSTETVPPNKEPSLLCDTLQCLSDFHSAEGINKSESCSEERVPGSVPSRTKISDTSRRKEEISCTITL